MQSFFSDLYQYLQSPITWIAFIFGAFIGSFLNVCIIRIPEKSFFKYARSVCPHCSATIAAWHNIPIISWLLLKGQTKCCNKPIAKQYLIVEILTAVMFPFIYWHFPFIERYHGEIQLNADQFIRFVHFLIFSCLLLICSVIDLRHQIIPDVISLTMIAVTPFVVIIHPELSWRSALFGVIVGGGSLYFVAWVYYILRKEAGIGMGDVKLLAAIGGWLGWQSLVYTVFLASLMGAIFGIAAILYTREMSLRSAIPFGPFLAFGAFVDFLYRTQISSWFFHL